MSTLLGVGNIRCRCLYGHDVTLQSHQPEAVKLVLPAQDELIEATKKMIEKYQKVLEILADK